MRKVLIAAGFTSATLLMSALPSAAEAGPKMSIAPDGATTAQPEGNQSGLRLGVALDNAGGGAVKVVDVVQGTPAAAHGIQVGDRVHAIGGVTVQGLGHAVELVHDAPQTMILEVRRGGIPVVLTIPLGGEATGQPAAPPARAVAAKQVAAAASDEEALAAIGALMGDAAPEPDPATVRQETLERALMEKVEVLLASGSITEEEAKEAMDRYAAEFASRGGGGTTAAPSKPSRGKMGLATVATATAEGPPEAAPAVVPVAPPEASPEAPPPAAATPTPAPAPTGAVAAATTGPVGPASPLIPMGTSGKRSMNYSCNSGLGGTATVPVGACQSDRDAYARAVACGERSSIKHACSALYSCLGKDVSAYCPF